MLVVVWAAVLVPMWLRRHDSMTESRSMDRFSTAMRVLSRRPPYGGARYVVVPPAVSERPYPPAVAGTGSSPPREARVRLRERRARLLLGLVGVAALTLVWAVLGVISWVPHVLLDLLLVGYVVHLRMQVVKTATLAEAPSLPADGVGVHPPYAEQPAAGAPPTAAPTEPAAERGWEPLPVPLPTYVTAPVVPGPVRRPLVRAPAAEGIEPEDGEVEVLYQRRWAVND